MISRTRSNRGNAKTYTSFELLPKGAYVIALKAVKEEKNRNGSGSHLRIRFDIAEGEYKDFYKKQFEANTNEDPKWPNDAIYTLSVPDDNSPEWMLSQWDTFWTHVEDSNPGYIFDGDEKKIAGKVVGGLFHIEQSEYNDNVYDHTRLKWTRPAQDVRDGKYGKLPKDKLIASKPAAPALDNSFVDIPDDAPDDGIPF